MDIKYTIMLIFLGYLLFIRACWKFFIIHKINLNNSKIMSNPCNQPN